MSERRSILTTAAMFEPCALATTAAGLKRTLHDAEPAEIVEQAQRTLGRGRVAVVASFGTESAALLAIVADIDPTMPVLFVDTGWMLDDTLGCHDALTARLGLTDVRTVASLPAALAGFDGWIEGKCRPDDERAGLPVVETDGLRLRFNALARVTRDEIDAAFGGSRAGRQGWSAKIDCGIHPALTSAAAHATNDARAR